MTCPKSHVKGLSSSLQYWFLKPNSANQTVTKTETMLSFVFSSRLLGKETIASLLLCALNKQQLCFCLLFQLQIWDTAGQERFRKSMVEHYYRSVHAVIFVYDVTNLPSFESIPEWVEECSKHAVGPLVPRIIVGNKCDLREHRQVPASAAHCLADGYNFPLFETSAKDPAEKEHVDAIFLTLAYRLKSHKPLRLKQLSESSVRELRNQREQETTFCQC